MRALRFVIRSLRRAPGFATAAVLTIALGIGAATTIFSIVYGVLLRPLPYRSPDRIVLIEGWSSTFAGRQIHATACGWRVAALRSAPPRRWR